MSNFTSQVQNLQAEQIDVDQIVMSVMRDVQKVRVLLDDVMELYCGADIDNPSKLEINRIKYGFKQTALKLELINDVLDNITVALQPVEAAFDAADA